MVTIKEIAKKLNVSPTTVSNYLNGRQNKISEEVKKKIAAELEEVNYVPRMGLRVLSKQKSKVIGVVINPHRTNETTVLENPFYGKLVGSIEQKLHDYGYYLMIYCSNDMKEIYRWAESWNLDGVIGVTLNSAEYWELRKQTEIPIVLIDLLDENDQGIYSVGTNDFDAAYQLTKELMARGNKDIYAVFNEMDGSSMKRWKGMEKALQDAGVRDVMSHRKYIHLDEAMMNLEFGQIVSEVPKGSVLSFFCDIHALEMLGYLGKKGIRVPEEIGVTGFDNTAYSKLSHPPLTSVQQDIVEKGKQALNMLMKLIDMEPTEEKILLDTSIIWRESAH
jgi:DNA-binding LacI/PurR family transcriptional regulator